MRADPAKMRSAELAEMQSGASHMNATLEYAKTASLQYEGLLEESKEELIDWRHLEEAVEDIPQATDMMHVRKALNLVTGSYELTLGDAWHYFVLLHVL
mmetsp:Transcript_61390/g.51926  ORF Transcript_61390/g.51926 Transcript_61390/m.51926 type:complete len:99 (-) Transcript_61390:16-312(-)